VADLEVRPLPGQDVVVIAPSGTKLGSKVTYNSTKTRVRVKNTGTWVEPEPTPEPEPEPTPEPIPEPEPMPSPGRLPRITRAYVDGLPKSGARYTAIQTAAKSSTRPDLANQESAGSANILARAILNDVEGVKLDLAAARASVASASRVLSVGREAMPIVLAAQLVGLDPSPVIDAVLAKSGLEDRGVADGTVRGHAQKDPTNWGTQTRATMAWFGNARSALAAESEDSLLRYLTTGAGFVYKSDQLSWMPTGMKVCIGPVGAKGAGGVDLDGAITSDAYRGGPPPTLAGDGLNYTAEGLQATVAGALALDQRGLDVWAWGNGAILRAGLWLYRMGNTLTGDDAWVHHVLRRAYGSEWPITPPTGVAAPGKGLSWFDYLVGS
jgi:hypothetical protein